MTPGASKSSRRAPLVKFARCIDTGGYEVALRLGKVYRLLEDKGAEEHSLARIVDESGEDYLFPMELFVSVKSADTDSR
jgi:hypothetical protein